MRSTKSTLHDEQEPFTLKLRRSKVVSIAKRGPTRKRFVHFVVRFARQAGFNPKRTWDSRACWKTKDSLPKPKSSCAKRSINFPTANPSFTKCSAQLTNDSKSPKKP